MRQRRKASTRSELTPEIHASVVAALRMGAFKKHAALSSGIPASTLDYWIAEGNRGNAPYVAFATDCERAIAEDAMRNQSIITRASMGKVEGDWRAAAWNLEKKHPKLYGRMAEQAKKDDERERPFSPWKVIDAPDALSKHN